MDSNGKTKTRIFQEVLSGQLAPKRFALFQCSFYPNSPWTASVSERLPAAYKTQKLIESDC